jgi:hypothetical protein
MYNIGDYDLLTESMITVKKTIGQQDVYFGQYDLHEHYQKITSNLDISATIREFNIPKDGKAVESARFYEDYVEWNLEEIEGNTSAVTADGIKAFMETFGKASGLVKKEVDNVEMLSSDIVDESSVERALVIPVVSNGIRNTLKFFFGFKDPTFAYSRKVDDGSLKVKQGIRYTNSDGFLNTVTLNYGKKHNTQVESDVDALPVANAINYSGNPLIAVGASQTLEESQLLPFRTYSQSSGFSFAKFDLWSANIVGGISSTVKTATFIMNDNVTSGNIIYGVTTVEVTGIDINDNIINYGKFTFTPNVALTIPINDNIKTIQFETDVVGSKDDPDAVYSYTIITSYQQETITAGNGLKLDKDSGEILLQTYFLHNVFYKQTQADIGEIIIGDEAMLGNILVGGKSKSLQTELFIYESTTRYSKYERSKVKGANLSNALSALAFGTQSIFLTGVVTIADGNSWALGDDNGKLIFAVNPPRNINGVPQPVKTKISHNYTHFRTGLIR